MPAQHGSYFDAEFVSDTWTKADVEVTQHCWRRPPAAVVAEFSAAGFVIDAITEARPSEEALRRFPAELGPLTDVPSFIVYRLRSGLGDSR
ncbi:hypothetical protein [Nocardia jiangxiensis]|uniref:hypothetical protein n=1 Tax=Nocardia jiangxiensis TaxID=282685 RepID=UPI000683F617|nr:hypothetical protein [Nocardia jiangxiensis]